MEEKTYFGDSDSESAIPFSYMAPKLTLTRAQISRCRDENLRLLLSKKKLQLVLDLDHTLVHGRKVEQLTSEEKERIKFAEDVYVICSGKIVVKLRPGIREFIKEVSSLFDVSIYTMGNRAYGVAVHRLLVSKVGFPLDCWVIAKEDCLMNGQKRLDVVLSHERVVLIVDDTEDVWGDEETGNKSNLITIGKYDFIPFVKRGDEEGSVVDTDTDTDTELGRALNVLKGVHAEFFYEDINHIDRKDVRDVLKKTISSPSFASIIKNEFHDHMKRCRDLVIKYGGKRLMSSDNNQVVDDVPACQQTTCAPAAKRCRKLEMKFGSFTNDIKHIS